MDDLLSEVKIIVPQKFADTRGSMRINEFSTLLPPYVPLQVNSTISWKKGTLRGLHYQAQPFEQAKYVICTMGSVLSAAVDIRKDSPTFGKYKSEVLSAADGLAMYIPKGFAHGYLTLEDNCMLQYYVDNHFSPEHAKCLRYDDSDIGINWSIGELSMEKFIVSDKDKNGLFLKDL